MIFLSTKVFCQIPFISDGNTLKDQIIYIFLKITGNVDNGKGTDDYKTLSFHYPKINRP